MKTKIGLFLFTILVMTSMGFAAPGAVADTPKSYYNLITHVVQSGGWGYGMGGGTTTLVLSQGPVPCTSSDWSLSYNGTEYKRNGAYIGHYYTTGPTFPGMPGGGVTMFSNEGECIASVEDTPANLATMLEQKWINGGASMRKVPLELWSDIDLKEFAANTGVGKCAVNHVPLPMMDSTSFNGNGFTISHLCYAANVTSENPMESPVGFFKTAENVMLMNVRLNGVRIYIDGESTDGSDYYPVGAFVGAVNLVTIDSVILVNDSIQAPFAGGLVGLVKNSTISNITGDDDINISNIVSITTGHAGSKEILQSAGHNVFLGGIAGVAIRSQSEEDATFVSDSIKVDVHDYATGHKSTLGGIAGLYQTIGGTAEKLNVYTKRKEGGETIPTKISGGASMGGLFGVLYVPRDYNAPSAGHFVATNNKFDGKIYDAASPNMIAVGGILGLDSTESGTSVHVKNSVSSIDVKDSLKVPGSYQYYAGGIVGYGATCIQGGANGDDFLSVSGVKTAGSIALSASGAEVAGLHTDTYLGGVVGSACIAQTKGLGLTNDTSLVQITSKVKTSVDAGKTFNGAHARDSVYVGGIIGFASMMIANEAATMSQLYYDGSIVVEDSLNNVFVGGVLGGFTKTEGAKSLVFEDVYARSADVLIKYTAKEAGSVSTTNIQIANIGGLCGVCNEISDMNRVSVQGNISVVGKHAGNYLYVGGLVGNTEANEVKTVVRNTFSVGNISVTANNASVDYEKKVGYLIGRAQLNKGYEIKSSYHFGEDDDETVTLPMGVLNTEMLTNGWLNSDSISHVVRNGSATQYSDPQKNGTETTKNMKSSQFAGFLNAAYADSDDYEWAFVKDNNGSLPFLKYGAYNAVKPSPSEVKHLVSFVDKNDSLIDQQVVAHGGAATAPANVPVIEGYTFTNTWDKDFDNVLSDLTVKAVYTKNSYTVRFFDYDNTQFGTDQKVPYQESANAPDSPERVGYAFAGWDDSTYLSVTKNLDVHATYVPKKYWIVFRDYDGSDVTPPDSILYGAVVPQPVDLSRASTEEYTYEFKGWDPEVVKVNGDAVYTAVYDSTKRVYAVNFVDYDDTPIGDTVWVEYGSAAVAPADPTRDGYKFTGWDRKFDVITKSVEVKATYEKLPESSSSVEVSSSSEPESSSSEPESSSSVEVSSSSESESSSSVEESSSSVEVSSSSEPESSSSVQVVSSSSMMGDIKIVAPTIKMSGNNAVLLTFSTENVDESAKAYVVVRGENGVLLEDTIPESVVNGGQWEFAPAPIGKFTVTLTVGDKVRSDATYTGSFEVASEIKTTPGSWQMVSLAAFDRMKVSVDDAAFYWWDEKNPVGDYWQYRAYDGGSVDATRGFWYGTTDGNPLVIRESTGSRDSEIVWELDSLYSGWNLVANPYGWNVNLKKGSSDNGTKVAFGRWIPSKGGYELVHDVIGPYEAVWAKVSKSTTWRMPAAPDFEIETRTADETKKAMHKDAAGVKGAWSLMVSLADDYGRQDSWNVIGAGTEESLDEPPAGMGSRVSLAIRNSEKGAKLAKSIKAVANEYRWVLDVSANTARDGKLKFEGVKELNGKGLKLFVTAEGVTTEVTDEKAMNVALAKSAKQVEVRVAASNAVVASSKISGFGSTLAGGALQLGFTAPEALAGARASYAVVGVDGKKVAAGQFKATAGTNRFSLNAPKSGVYFVKIKVGSQQLSGKVLVK